MNRSVNILASVMALMAWAGNTQASVAPQPLLRTIMAFAAQHTGLPPLRDGVPKVGIATPRELHDIYRPGAAFDPDAVFQIQAVYLEPPTGGPGGVILMVEGWSSHTDAGLAVLVHEMVHALQYGAGENRSASCLNELERDAFDAQKAFLRSLGHENPHDVMKTGPLAIVLLSRCPQSSEWP